MDDPPRPPDHGADIARRRRRVTATLTGAAPVSPPAPAPPRHWEDVLALARSLDDAPTAEVAALAPVTRLCLDAIAHGSGTVPVRAAYQLGRAHARLVARARGTLVGEPVPAELQRATRIAIAAFTAVDRAARRHPELADDPTTAPLVASVQAVLRGPS